MKILIKGRLIVYEFMADLKSDALNVHAGAKDFDESEFEVVLTGDVELDSIVLNGAAVYVTREVVVIGKTKEQ